MTEATKERDTSNPDEVDPRKGSKTIDIRDMYKFEPEDLAVDISTTCYSNLAYIQVAPRDVIIDFLGLPGVKRDKKMVVSGTRVFMSHAAAQKLVESLSALLENSYNDGKLETFELPQSRDVELTTKIKRPSEEKQT
jgi:Protein of unknown function (DUF3467)